ncbi:MAG TPA: kelch repeat-containing protein [Thermoanaerobaculia bacterium]|nr:kelch repeat-containing protein [Thermoanaerobaculia bacterium]
MRVIRRGGNAAHTARVCSFFIALLLSLFAPPATAAPQRRVLFGPETFTRSAEAPNAFMRTFGVTAPVGAPVELVVENGGASADTSTAVASGSILIDGAEIVSQNEFRAGRTTKPLTLAAGSHTLEVRLNGAPDHFLVVSIAGTIAVANLSDARAGHTATLQPDGNVLIAGGRNASGVLASAELFDSRTLTTRAAAPLNTRRAAHSAAALAKPQTLFAGGTDGATTLGSAEIYDAASGTFTTLAASLQLSRSGHTATLLPDGRLLILGGTDTSGNPLAASESFDAARGAAIYDPRNGAFRVVANALSVARSGHTATLLPNGTILVAGGRNNDGVLASAELFDPVSGTSRAAGAMTTARSGQTATLLPNGRVLIAGGRSSSGVLASTETYDPAAQTFTAATPLQVARSGHTATLLPNGEILIAAGETANGITNATELIGPAAADNITPTIAAFQPANGATDVPRSTIVSVRFSEPIDPSSINATTLQLRDGTTVVATARNVAESGLYAFLVPNDLLVAGRVYTIAINGVRDLAGNTLTAAATFTTVAPPSITNFAPLHGIAGTEVTIRGAHFDSSAPDANIITIGNARPPVLTATATTLTFRVPALAAGPYVISVETNVGRADSVDPFVVDNPAPTLTSFTPNTAAAGTNALDITVTGNNFVPGAALLNGTTPLVTRFVSATQLVATLAATDLQAAGTLLLSVQNPAPGGGTSNALPFTVTANRGAIGDYIWRDENRDGVQDADESGLAGVTVQLRNGFGTLMATTTTNTAGGYLFTDLAAGDYQIEVVPPDGFTFSTAFSISDDAVDSDIDPLLGITQVKLAGGDRLDVDAGLYTPPTTLTTSPNDGAANVAVTRETIFRLSGPLAESTVVDGDTLYAEWGGQRLPARIHVAPDRKTITLFYDRDLPASARVHVTLIGNDLRDTFGARIDADGDGLAGGTLQLEFDTLSLTTLPNTKVCGRVFASQLAPGNALTSVNVPLAGVTITVDGLEETLRTTTDAQGNFCLDPAPAGDFFVHIDGRTATNPIASGDYYPTVGKLWTSIAGQSTTIGDVFLPRIIAGTLQPVSRTSDTTVTMPPAVLAQFPSLQGVQIVVPADSLYSDDGSRGGRVGIAPVPPDRLPAPLPPGLSFPLVITVQTDGGANFDKPVPACFPNLATATGPALAPGAKSALWSFNHDTGQFEIVGPMTVSADGALVCTDPGFGILAPGWHGTQPGCIASSDAPAAPPPPKTCPQIISVFTKDYAKTKGTSAAVLSHQLLCLAQKGCKEGPHDDPFVHDVLNDIANDTGTNPAQETCQKIPPVIIPLPPINGIPVPPTSTTEICAVAAGYHHFLDQLLPAFFMHCPINDGTHEDFFNNAVVPCFDELYDDGEIGWPAKEIAQHTVPFAAGHLRDFINGECPVPLPRRLGSQTVLANAPQSGDAALPSKNDLYLPDLESYYGNLRVTAADGSYFLHTGRKLQLKVTLLNDDGTTTDLTSHTTGTYYYGAILNGTVTITPDGFLTILRGPSVAGDVLPLYVYATNGDKLAIGQFAIYDDDTDADGLNDGAESRAGLDPFRANDGHSDLDRDGLTDIEEVVGGTNPRLVDTDGDRLSDYTERFYGLNPLVPNFDALVRYRSLTYYTITNLFTGFTIRGVTSSTGTADNILLRSNEAYIASYYNPKARGIGRVLFISGADGTRIKIPIAVLTPSLAGDSDNDGLADDVETIIGTDPNRGDSDNDGVIDGAEVDESTNPLDNRQARTGIIATAATPGTATDVAALNDIVAVAGRNGGVSLFNVFNGMNPTIIGQVSTSSAQAVAFSGNTLAVADGPNGLTVIDASIPSAARVVRNVRLFGVAQCVTASAGVAYVGTDLGQLYAIDLASGTILHHFSGAVNIYDVTVAGETLYVVAGGDELRAYSLPALQFLGSIHVNWAADPFTQRRRVFAANGRAYVTSYPGYDVVDVSDPAHMKILGPASQSLGVLSFKQIVLNGSGLGVAAVGPNPRDDGQNHIWLYDATNPANTTAFLSIMQTPGVAFATTIYNGLAYVADGAAGLQVMNYLPFDTRGVAPSITLTSNFSAGVAEENKPMLLTAAVSDDVQVRNVEFYIDGVKAQTDGNYPFEYRFITPPRAQQTSFTVHACATDTGGNRTCTQDVVTTLTDDATPPRVIAVAPLVDGLGASGMVSAISASFSEPLAAQTPSATTFRLFRAGADKVIGTADDVLVSGGVVSFRIESNTAFLTFSAALPVDKYRAILSATIPDPRGNTLGSDFAWNFQIRAPFQWINAAGGDWTNAANWDQHTVPGASDIALITLPGSYTVIANGIVNIGKVTIGGGASTPTLWIRGSNFGSANFNVADALENFGGTIRMESNDSTYESNLSVPNAELINRGTINVNAGTLGSRRIAVRTIRNDGAININYTTNIFADVINNGTVSVAAGQQYISAANFTFTHNGGDLTGAGLFRLPNDSFAFNGGTVTNAPMLIDSALTISPSATGAATFIVSRAARISGQSSPGQTIWVRGASFDSDSLATFVDGFVNGGTIRMESIDSTYRSEMTIPVGSITNTGIISANAGSGGAHTITGALTNRGALNINVTTTYAGTLTNDGGTVTTASGQKLTFGRARTLRQNGGTINTLGGVELNQATLDFNGGTFTGQPPLLVDSTLNIGPNSTGAATIILAAASTMNGSVAPAQTLWIRGSGFLSNANVTPGAGFINHGTLRLESIDSSYDSNITGGLTNAADGVINVNAGTGGARRLTGTWQNNGTINFNQAAILGGPFTNDGTLNVKASSTLNGTFTSSSGAINISANQRLTHNGANALFLLNGGNIANDGAFELQSGTFKVQGGTTSANPLLLGNSSLVLSDPSSVVDLMMSGTATATGTLGRQQTLWIAGGNGYGNITFTPVSFTNHGTLRFESRDATYGITLAGTTTNASDGVINVRNGSGGPRDFSGTLLNDGALNIDYPVTLSGTITNSGTVTLAARLGCTKTSIFNHNGGTLNTLASGAFEMFEATFNFNGGTFTGLPPALIDGKFNFGPNSAGSGTVAIGGVSTISGATAPGQVVWIRGGGLSGNTTVTAAPGFINNGTLRLESIVSTYQSTLAGAFTNGATGVVDVNVGTGGQRFLTGAIRNDGTINLNQDATVSGPLTNNAIVNVNSQSIANGTFTNNGTVTIAAGKRLVHNGANALFLLNGGNVANAGAYEMQSGTFRVAGGTTSGVPLLLGNSSLIIDNPQPAVNLSMAGSCSASGTLGASQTLWIAGGNFYGTATFTPNNFTNNGTLRLESRDSSYETNLAGTMTNGATGVMSVNDGTHGQRTFSGTLTNEGTLNINYPVTFTNTINNSGIVNISAAGRLFANAAASAFHHNGGNLAVTGSFELQNGTFHENGGATSGNLPLIGNAKLNLGPNSGAATLLLAGTTQLSGDIGAGETIWIAGMGNYGDAAVTAPASFTNAGTLRLESMLSSYITGFTVTGTITNDGAIQINSGTGGQRKLTAGVVNRGTFTVSTPLTFAGTTFQNAAGGTLRGSSTLTLSTATLANDGTIAPGTSPGILTVSNVNQSATGGTSIEIGSAIAGSGYDRLAITGAATLNGVLNLSLLNAYDPPLGTAFDILTFGSRSGTFSTINGATLPNGKKLDVTYGTTKVTATVVAQ